MKNNLLLSGVLALAIFTLFNCSSPTTEESPKADTLSNFTVTPADDWTNLFYRKSGLFGADGIFAIPLDGIDTLEAGKGKTTMLIFSDTMTGEVMEDSVHNFKMVNSSVAYVRSLTPTEDDIDIIYKKTTSGEADSFFDPSTPNSSPHEYYWMGDGFVNQELDNTIYIFGYRVVDHSDAAWDFEIVGTTLIAIPEGSKPPFENHREIDTDLLIHTDSTHSGTFGSGIFVNTKKAGAPDPDGYMYIYGLVDPGKHMVVARVKPAEFETFDAWRFWDGQHWQEQADKSAPITDRVSNELSVTPMKDGRYLLVFQEDGIGEYVSIRIGKTPIGPFGPIQRIWHAPEANQPPGIIPYNAKVHYSLSTKEELLISYNTISLDYFNDILKFPHMYRPRFIRLKINE